MMEALPAQSQAIGRLDLAALVAEVESQPSLFEPDGTTPVDFGGLKAAREITEGAVFAFTGKITSRNEQKAAGIALLRLSGVSKREIARRVGCSRNVIDAVIDKLEDLGKLEPLKDRLPRLLGRVAEDAAEAAREIIDSGVIDTATASYLKSLGVLAGIGADKSAAAQSISGDLHLHQHLHVGDADPLRDYLSQRAQALATESNAGGNGAKSLPRNGSPDLAAGVAAGSGAVVEVEATIEAPDPTGSGPDQAAADDRGAGGVGDARGASHL
jgi:transposase-like protein